MKTYTVELTEDQAKALCSILGPMAGGKGSIREVLQSVYFDLIAKNSSLFLSILSKDEKDAMRRIGQISFHPIPSVTLNSSHTAIVTPEGIKVGCQTFPLSVVDELVKAVREVRG